MGCGSSVQDPSEAPPRESIYVEDEDEIALFSVDSFKSVGHAAEESPLKVRATVTFTALRGYVLHGINSDPDQTIDSIGHDVEIATCPFNLVAEWIDSCFCETLLHVVMAHEAEMSRAGHTSDEPGSGGRESQFGRSITSQSQKSSNSIVTSPSHAGRSCSGSGSADLEPVPDKPGMAKSGTEVSARFPPPSIDYRFAETISNFVAHVSGTPTTPITLVYEDTASLANSASNSKRPERFDSSRSFSAPSPLSGSFRSPTRSPSTLIPLAGPTEGVSDADLAPLTSNAMRSWTNRVEEAVMRQRNLTSSKAAAKVLPEYHPDDLLALVNLDAGQELPPPPSHSAFFHTVATRYCELLKRGELSVFKLQLIANEAFADVADASFEQMKLTAQSHPTSNSQSPQKKEKSGHRPLSDLPLDVGDRPPATTAPA